MPEYSQDDQAAVTITHAGEVRQAESRPPITEAFDVVGTVGSGGMGDVHAAKDLDLGRVVALKVIGGDQARNQALTARFLTEAQVTAQLDHPHIVPVYGLETTEDGYPAFSMKLIRGRTLKDVVTDCQEGKGLSLMERLEAFVGVCDAMAYAHERGVVHRDLKPANIMVGKHGEVYVVDWGVAKVLGRADEGLTDLADAGSDSVFQTQAGVVLGTPVYLSPELARGEAIDGRSDQYTLGLILQELVALERAIPAKSSFHALALAEEGVRRPLEGIPGDLDAIITKACAVDVDDRYPDCDALAQDVRRYIRGEMVAVRPDGPMRALWRWTRSNPVPTLVSLGTVFGVGAVVTILSLVAVVVGQVQSAASERQMAERVSAVSRRSQAIDSQMLRYQALLDGLAQQAVRQWSDGVPSDDPQFDREDYRTGEVPGYGPSGHYEMPVTFEHPLTLRAPGVTREETEAEVARLSDMRLDFKRAFLRAESEEALALPPDQQELLLREEGVPPAWVYIGLENGVLLNYPGHPKLGEEYDPRKRPWYVASEGTRGPHWGEPYQGASGYSILVPCNEALYDRDGEFFGVVGFDVALDTVIEMMAIDLEGASRTWMVDSDGQVVVSSDQKGLNLGEGLHGNEGLGTEPFPHDAVRTAIAGGAEFGNFEVDGGTVIFDRMDALGFVYAVEIEE